MGMPAGAQGAIMALGLAFRVSGIEFRVQSPNGPRLMGMLKLSDTRVYEPQIRSTGVQGEWIGRISNGSLSLKLSDTRVYEPQIRSSGRRERGSAESHLETLIIYKLSSRKFTAQNDLYS